MAKLAAGLRDRSPSRVVRLLLLLVAMLAVSACDAVFEVDVTVEEDGSGIVETILTLDPDASDALLDLDLEADGLPLVDLAQSGWDVGAPERAADGSTVITAAKEFGTTSQFSDVMAEITGDDGVFRNFRIDRTKTFARVDYRVTGTIDTSGGLESFGDDALTDALGLTVAEVARTYGATEEDVRFDLEVLLPGELEGEPAPELLEGNRDATEARGTWVLSLADPEVTEVELESATREVSALVLRGIAVVAGVLAGLVVFAQLLRILLPDRRRRRSPRRRVTDRVKPPDLTAPEEPTTAESTSADATADGSGVGGLKVVALDGLGVLYRRGEDAGARAVIAFARERASRVTDDEIEAKARLLELGRITTGEFWRSIGVDGVSADLDAEYLSQLQLTPGVIKYLRALRDRGIQVACITNDAAEWASRLKTGHSLEGLVDPWVISGAVGVRKPDMPIFEVLRRVTGADPASIQLVDDDLDILDAARDLGFATAWFSADGSIELARGHAVIRNFEVVAEDVSEPEPTA